MPTNRISIEYKGGGGEPLGATLWDKDGEQHDMIAIFKKSSGAMELGRSPTGVVTQELQLLPGTNNSLETSIKFVPLKKDVAFDVELAVSEQILGMLT